MGLSYPLSCWCCYSLFLWSGATGVAVHWRQFPLTALREIRLLKYLRHDNIVNLKEIVTGTSFTVVCVCFFFFILLVRAPAFGCDSD